tara:strand:+ start:281 stop:505 length:225 start_codon:yes stop_codon:yes gene_type:complete
MTVQTAEITKLDFRSKGKEEFTIELDKDKNTLTLYVNQEKRNIFTTDQAEEMFEKFLKLAKLKFIKMREKEMQN